MKSIALTAFPRAAVRRSGVKQLRAQGRVPAVIYGSKIQPKNLEVKAKEIGDIIHHSANENLLLDLTIEGESGKRLALLQEIQHNPLSGNILHLDFHEVAEDEKVIVMVPVQPEGEAVGVKAGGILESVLFKIKVRALPKDLPEMISVDVSHLEIGKVVSIGEIKPPSGVEVLGKKDIPVFAVAAPVSEAEEQAAAEAAAGTPAAGDVEMIKEKKDEEGAEGAVPAKGAAPAAKGAAAPAAAKGAAPAAEKAAAAPKAEKKK